MSDFATNEDLQAIKTDFREMSRDIVAQINRRLDKQDEVGNVRHEQNIDRMEIIAANVTRVEIQTTKTNGRVTALEAIVNKIIEECATIRKRGHDLRNDVQNFYLAIRTDINGAIVSTMTTLRAEFATSLSAFRGTILPTAPEEPEGEERKISQRELGILAAYGLGVATVAVTITLWIVSLNASRPPTP